MDVQRLKKLTIWPFSISFVLCCWNECFLIWRAVHQNSLAVQFRTFLILACFPVLAVIYGTASWNLWKGKPSGRVWGLIAALTFALIPLWAISHYSRPVPGAIWVMFAIGIFSLAVLLWPERGNGSMPNSGDSMGSGASGPDVRRTT